MSTITIKFVYQSETRRATYTLPITLQQIHDDIAKTITGTSDFTIRCYHDYREVSINTESNFQQIVQHHSEKTLPLRIRISHEKDEIEIAEIENVSKSIPQPSSPSRSPQMKRKEVESSHNVNCSLCLNKIHGIRWKCTVCPHYDLCNNCEQSHIRSHPLIRIVEELPPSSEVVFSVCTGLHQINQKFEKISESTPITTATSTAKTAKEEITEFFSDLTTQAYNNTTHITHEIGGMVQDASKIVQNIPRRFKDLQTKLTEMIITGQATPAPAAPPCVPNEKGNRTEEQPAYLEQLEALENMGFSQRERNVVLLSKHKGNLEMCVNDLLED